MKTRKTRSTFTGRALAASLALSAFCGFAETPDYFVEWVKPSGNLYVDTGIRGKAGTKIYVRLYHADADTYANIIGASATDGSKRVGVGFYGASYRYKYGGEYADKPGTYVPYTYDYIIEQEYSATGVATSTVTYPGGRQAQDVQTGTGTFDYAGTQGVVDSGVSLYLFAQNRGGTAANFHRGRLYECKVWQLDANNAWQLVGNFMPCVKDGVAGVYDATSETILYPVGNTLTAGPAKYDSSWPAAAKVGSVDHPATLWGRIYYGAARSGMGNGEWKNIVLTDYTLRGAGDIANLNGNNTTWQTTNLKFAQLRFDGWFYVSADKAGSWVFTQKFDDYFSFSIDGVNIICNPTYKIGTKQTATTAAHDIAAGWHRFTIVAGDTTGGIGSDYIQLDGTYVPFTVSINGGAAMAFDATNFPQGNGSNTYTLTSNEDWSDRGAILLAGGAVLDLNGHQLTVKDVVCDDYLGAMVTNSASNKAVLIFTGEPSVSKAVTDGLVKEVGTKILLAKAGELSATWTGAADGVSANNAGNWVDTLTGEAVVPNANYAVKIAGTAVGLQIPAGSSFACKSFDIGACTLTANCDWTGLSVKPTISGTANLNGHTLTLNNLSAQSGAAFSGTDGSAVAFPVSDTSYDTFSEADCIDNIGNITLSGSAKILLPKDGAGTFAATTALNMGTASGRVVEFKQTDGDVSIAIGTISQVAGAKATYTLTDGTVNANTIYVGYNGTGSFTQDGGTNTVVNSVRLAEGAGSQGTYTLNDGVMKTTYWLHVGVSGTGSFVQNGGEAIAEGRNGGFGNWLSVGYNAGSTSTYVMNDGLLRTQNGIRLGYGRGTGTFTLNGGTVVVPTIEDNLGVSALVLNGGTIKASANGNILNKVDNVVFGGNATTIDTDGHSTSIVGCGYDTIGGGSLVKAGAGTLTVDAMPPVSTLVVSNGTLALSAAADNSAPLAALAHRWSFAGNLKDSVTSDESAEALGSNSEGLTYSDGKAILPGGGNQTCYINLGAGKIPSNAMTIEVWFTPHSLDYWTHLFAFGDSSGNNGLPFCARRSTNVCSFDTAVQFASSSQLVNDTTYHIAISFAPIAGNRTAISVFAKAEGADAYFWTKTQTVDNWMLRSNVKQDVFWLGRSPFGNNDIKADYDEVRIWNGALSEDAIALSYAKGADATTEDIAAIVAKNAETPVDRTLDLAGGTLDMGSYTLTQPNLTGNGGAVRNGTLVVTDTIRLNVGDSITASGTLDLSNAKVEIVDVENLSTPFTFIKPAENGTLTVVGTPEAVNLPSGWKISASSSGAKVQKVGFTIYVR